MATERATTRYNEVKAQVDSLVDRLAAQIKADAERIQAKGGADWGDVGSLDHTRTKLLTALAHYNALTTAEDWEISV